MNVIQTTDDLKSVQALKQTNTDELSKSFSLLEDIRHAVSKDPVKSSVVQRIDQEIEQTQDILRSVNADKSAFSNVISDTDNKMKRADRKTSQ